jgi:glycosyltransferase involved in cell wall biosynthesis/CBS domain-containing protein
VRDIESERDELQKLPVTANLRLRPPTVSNMESVSVVLDTIINEDVGAVIIVDDGNPVGIITEKDVLARVVQPQKDFETTLAKDVMSKPLISIDKDSTIKDALELMGRHNIRRLVVTENNNLLGLATERRLLEVAHGRYMMKNYNTSLRRFTDHLNTVSVVYLSSYPPRICGIATYTSALILAVSRLYSLKSQAVFAVNERGDFYNYGSEVELQIDTWRPDSYGEAAEYINQSNIGVVNIQHEFGLFGGSWGENILGFLETLKKPIVTTLHTLSPEPEPQAKRVLGDIIVRSNYVVVMAKAGKEILEQVYDTPKDKVRFIPHGCPNVPFILSQTIKSRLGLEDRTILSTFGLLSPGKGIEYAIQSLPPIVKLNPRILYLIIGDTHPVVRKHEGERYRKKLIDLVDSLGLEENVRFVSRFLPLNDLIKYLQATDIYLLPYPNRDQISSGTLLYALSTGKAIVSTPFLHAQEVISEGCAWECGFRDPESISEKIGKLLKHRDMHRQLEEKAYNYSRDMIWPNVAMQYVNLFYETLGM